MSIKKKILSGLLVTLFLGVAYYVWYVHFNFRFAEVSEPQHTEKVYQSALIAPDKIGKFIKKAKIKTVIDFLDASVQNKLNPASQKNIDAEDKAIANYNQKNNTAVQHINIPSGQVPSKKALTEFFKVMDNKENYPVLVHCYHGTGRTEVYASLYRIEYEKWKNEAARKKTRVVVEGLGYTSSFGKGREKGDFLINYKPRSDKNATLNTLK